jgi:hypothetical protein
VVGGPPHAGSCHPCGPDRHGVASSRPLRAGSPGRDASPGHRQCARGPVAGGSGTAGRDGAAGAPGCRAALQCRRSGGSARPAPLGSAGGADAGTAGGAQGLGAARPRPGARRGERLAGGRQPRPCRGGRRRALPRVGHGAALEAAGSLAPEGSTPASAGQRGRAVESAALDRSKNGLGSKLEEIAAAHPDAQVQLWCEDEARIGQKGRVCTAGTSAASVRPAWPTSASTASICSPPAGPARTRPSPSPCPRRPPRAGPCSWRASPESSGPACTRR